jgi:serine/threonine-protein kinase RsbT
MSTDPSAAGEAPLRSAHDIVLARQIVRRLSQELRFSLVDQTKMVTAASELARNTLIYGGGGVMRWDFIQTEIRKGLRLVFSDQGPGIPNLELALTDGWTSGGGLGLGLSGARRLVNDFEIESSATTGTRVTIVRWS